MWNKANPKQREALVFIKSTSLSGQSPLKWSSYKTAAAAAKSLQSCPTLCDPIDGSPPGFPVPGILQARTLEWVAISFSNVWKWKVKVRLLSRVQLLGTPGTTAHQAPLSMGFSRQEHWSGVPSPSPVIRPSDQISLGRKNSRDCQFPGVCSLLCSSVFPTIAVIG